MNAQQRRARIARYHHSNPGDVEQLFMSSECRQSVLSRSTDSSIPFAHERLVRMYQVPGTSSILICYHKKEAYSTQEAWNVQTLISSEETHLRPHLIGVETPTSASERVFVIRSGCL